MEQYLIVCPLIFLAGLVDSIAGGGGMISLPAYMLAGVPVHMTLGTSKLSSSIGTVVAAGRFAKNGYIRWKIAIPCAMLALVGSAIGANIALMMSEKFIQSLMIVVLPVIAFYVLRNKQMDGGEKEAVAVSGKMLAISCGAAFVIGLYNGFYGPGTGTFLILVFTGVVKMGVKEAAGAAKIINLSSDVAAMTTFLINGKVLWPLGLTAALFSIAGCYIGSGLVVNNGLKIVRPVVLVVLGALFIKIIMGW